MTREAIQAHACPKCGAVQTYSGQCGSCGAEVP